MSEWKAKRFWKDASVVAEGQGYTVQLDGRPVRSPLKTLVTMPTRSLATAVADEWQAQEERIDPLSMPLTRAVNATLDKVVPQQAEVVANLAEYGGSDLLCYRAGAPAELVAQQDARWNPVLDWAETALSARLVTTVGVIPVAQDAAALGMLRARVADLSVWELTAFSEFVTLSGSLILALAVMEGHLSPPEAWNLSRLDEEWQIAQWGEDEAEAALVARKRAAFLQAWTYLGHLRAA
ncbi:ATP12 family chaperone protein [Jannaschia sp. 2305UL9-9]|uniref:ATP12 family chaperone protein n=1 Tax=Jannaschia sp. 2305UL9-9 TaxID=3121638 RepID=UPI003526E466